MAITDLVTVQHGLHVLHLVADWSLQLLQLCLYLGEHGETLLSALLRQLALLKGITKRPRAILTTQCRYLFGCIVNIVINF